MNRSSGVQIIENKPLTTREAVREAVQYRALIFSMVRRELKVRYAQTLLGFFWSFMRPLSYLTIYTIFFSVIIKMDTGGRPFSLLALSGIMAWNYFQDIFHTAGQSLILDADLIKKNNVPRLILPLYRSLVGLVELCISLGIYIVLQLILGWPFTIFALFLPLIVLVNLFVGLAVALWTSAYTVRVRDFYHLVSTILNFGMWLTPVFYGPELVPDFLEWVLHINPMALVIALYRWALLAGPFPEWPYLMAAVLTVVLFISGLRAFVKTQPTVVDYL